MKAHDGEIIEGTKTGRLGYRAIPVTFGQNTARRFIIVIVSAVEPLSKVVEIQFVPIPYLCDNG